MSLNSIRGCVASQDIGRLAFEIKRTRWRSNVAEYLSSALNGADLSIAKKRELAHAIEHDDVLRARVGVIYAERDGERVPRFRVASPKPMSKVPFALIAVIVIALIAVPPAYDEFVREHPMESIGLGCDEEAAYACVPLTIRAEISPSNTTCRTLEWRASLEDAVITVSGDRATVLLGPTVRTGDVLKVTVYSERYGIEETFSIPVENEVKVVLDCASTDVWPGDRLVVKAVSFPRAAASEFQWSVDKKWADLSASGASAGITVDYSAKEGDSFTVIAKIPGTDIKGAMEFTVVEGLAIELSASSTTVDAGGTFQVDAAVKPCMPLGSSIQWSVNGSDVSYNISLTRTTLVGRVSDDADHGAAIVVTAYLSGYDARSQVTIVGNNPSRVPIDVRDVAGLMDMKMAGKVYNIQNDIDLSGVAWTPYDFKGILNGNGHKVTGLNLDVSKPDAGACLAGLFKTNSGTITDLNLEGCRIYFDSDHSGDGAIYAGTIAGLNEGTISRCSVIASEVSVHRDCSSTGGIVGYSTGTVSDSMVERLTMFGNGDMGGIAGSSKGGKISGCTVESSSIRHYAVYNQRSIGGIVGFAHAGADVVNCSVDSTAFRLEGDLSLKVHMGCVIGSLDDSMARVISGSAVTESYEGTMKHAGSWFFGVGCYDYSTSYFAKNGGNIGSISGSSSVS